MISKIKRFLSVLGILACLSLGSAQRAESYVGVGVMNLSVTSLAPLLSLQGSGPAFGAFNVQITLDTLLIANMVGVDLVYPLPLSEDLTLNLGAGAHFAQYFTGAGFGVHALTGLLYRFEAAQVGIFLDVRPTLLDVAYPHLDIFPRLGLNIYF